MPDTPDWNTIAEQEIESRRDELMADVAGYAEIPGRTVTCWECLGWWRRERCTLCRPGAFPRPLCIGGRAYSRRRAARKRRRR